MKVDDYLALKALNDPRISPDGTWVAYTAAAQDLENDQTETRLWMVSTSGGEPISMMARATPPGSPGGGLDLGGRSERGLVGLAGIVIGLLIVCARRSDWSPLRDRSEHEEDSGMPEREEPRWVDPPHL